MKNLLFPRQFKLVGWLLFIPAIILALLIFLDVLSITGVIETVVNDLAIIGTALGATFIVCSKEKCEDEMTRSIRLASLLNSLYVYVSLIIIGTIFINSVAFLMFAIAALLLLPVIYVVIFSLEMHRFNKMNKDEE